MEPRLYLRSHRPVEAYPVADLGLQAPKTDHMKVRPVSVQVVY